MEEYQYEYPKLIFLITTLVLCCTITTQANLIAEPVTTPDEPTVPNQSQSQTGGNTVPAFPLQAETQTCHLDLSNELFGGVTEACTHTLDRSRCCPVLAAWLFAAHARSALQLPAARPPIISPADSSSNELPMMPESDSQRCVASLHNSLLKHNIKLPQPNDTCDTILCFCGIRLHQIASLSCPSAFNLTVGDGHNKNATPTASVRNLEKNCRNSSYAGCTRCLGALDKIKGGDKNGTSSGTSRASKMLNKDCRLMGLTWLLARNKTQYIPTVSAVLRAIMYSAHPPHQSTCSPDQENMPLAVDSLQFNTNDASSHQPSLLHSLSSLFLFSTITLYLLLAV